MCDSADHSVCKLTPEAFSDPYHYLNMIETNEDVKRYRKEIMDEISQDKFKVRGLLWYVVSRSSIKDIPALLSRKGPVYP